MNKSTGDVSPSTTGRVSVLLAGVIVVVIFLSGWLNHFDDSLGDVMIGFNTRIVPSNIVIIEIDSQSLAQLNTWPWSRQVYARILDQLKVASVHSVFVDVDFSAVANDIDDQQLAQSVAELTKTAPVRFPAFVQPASLNNRQLTLQTPLPLIAENAELVAVNIQPGGDGLVRRLGSGFILDEKFYSSAWNTIASLPGKSTFVDYSINPQSFEYISLVELLNHPLQRDQLMGKDVLLGSTAIELGDIVPVPVYKALPGIVLHGIAVETLLRGGLYKASLSAAILLLALTWLVAAILVPRLNWYFGLVSVLLIAASFVPATYFCYQSLNIILPYFSLSLMLAMVYVAGLIAKVDLAAIQNLWLKISLYDSEKLVQGIFSTSNDGILRVDDQGFITSANDRCQSIFACEASAIAGRSIGEMMPIARQGIESLDREPFETNIIDSTLLKIPVEVCISTIVLSGKKSHIMAIRSLKVRKQREIALSYAVTNDKLTGLLNRVRFFELADDLIEKSSVSALVKLDIDYFSEINEIHGHSFGDKVLKILSQRVQEQVESRNLLGRIGKDDFAILLCNRRLGEVKALAEKLLCSLNQPFDVDGHVIDIFCHIGIAVGSDSRTNIEDLIRQTNIALQSAKSKGLEYDCCQEIEETIEPQRLTVIGAIKNSLRDNSFELAFQPKVRLDSGEPVGCEVLLRTPRDWDRDIPVFKLIEIAESTRLIADLTLLVVDKVFEVESEWRAKKLPRHVAINLSLGLLANDQFVNNLIRCLDSGSGYFYIELEITETSLAYSWEQSLNNLDRLIKRNVTFAIDDFGTGYSSLAYLRDLRATVLKIDRSFITDIHLKLENQSIVNSTIKMAHELGMTVVAEGIESIEERDFLRGCGCDYGQGFLFAKPMYFPQISTWFQSRGTNNVIMLPTKSEKNDG